MAIEQAPVPGFPLTPEEYEQIYLTLEDRIGLFPEEGLHQSLIVVLANAGERYTPVTCIMGEWTGFKGNIPIPESPDLPLCPNGHVLTEGFGIALGWVHDSTTLSMLLSNVSDVPGDEMQQLPPPAPLIEEET